MATPEPSTAPSAPPRSSDPAAVGSGSTGRVGGLPQPGRPLRPAHRRLPPLARTPRRAAARPPRRHRARRGLRHRTVPAAAAAQGRPHGHHRRDRRLRADARGRRRPGRRARLGQRAPDRRPGRRRADRRRRRRRPVLRGARRDAVPRRAGQRVRPSAARGGGGRRRREMAAPVDVALRAWVADLHAPFINDFTGFDQPWRLLAEFVPDLQVRSWPSAPDTSPSATPVARLDTTEQ